MFSAELPVLFYFVQVSGYLGTLEKSQKYILSTFRKLPQDQRGATGKPGGCLARPTSWPHHLPSWVDPAPPGALDGPLFILPSRKRRNKSRFSHLRRGAAATLCSSSES